MKDVLYNDEGARYKKYYIRMREHVTRCIYKDEGARYKLVYIRMREHITR